ncbi:MAG: efflux RND transporter permease subunit [Planctomycetota bacterium]|nr:MAG: efflux RND transporter permease subunit [Planctomycetota bacterium]
MILIIAAGLLTIFTMKVEFFPEFALDLITVTVPYLGASPTDVEDGVVTRVEEAVAAVDGIKRMTATAAEGAGMIFVEVEEYADSKEVLDNIKAEVDRIITFPEETEKPIITEITSRYEVITIVLYGDVSEKTLKKLADRVRDDLTAMENISQVDVAGVRPYEISIEVSEKTLRRYRLSFDEVARAVRESSLDIPAGSVKTTGGEILVRTEGQKYYGPEFEKIIVLSRNDGTKIRLADIAMVKDEFEDIDLYSRFNGKRAALVKVFRVGEQGALDIADTVNRYVQEKKGALPEGVSMATWQDTSVVLRGRMDLLTRNACLGLILVFVCLTLFLNIRLAFWTTMGIPISFLGAFWLLPKFDVSLNMISLFAFIMSLGLVVDDAIVVGENIFAYRRRGMSRIEAATKGVREMAAPVTMAVLTTIFAFLPLLFILGVMGKIMRVIPIVVISVLSISLVEALLILPAHLSGRTFSKRTKLFNKIDKIQNWTERRLESFINGPFADFVIKTVRWRYVTLATGLAVFIITIGWIAGGYIKVVFFDPVEADFVIATVKMPQGTPVRKTQQVIDKLERAFEQVRGEFDSRRDGQASIVKHMATTIGAQPASRGGGPVRGIGAGGGAHLGEVHVEFIGSEERDSKTESATKIEKRWREIVGEIPGVSSLTFMSEIVSTGEAINVELSHENFDVLLEAVEKLKTIVSEYAGVSDIDDSFEEGKAELKLELKDTGRTLGLRLSDLARQVRQGFYGEEAQRIQRGRDDIRVMVRYPEEERKSLADVENMRIRLADGTEIPFKTVADVKYGRGYATIRRADRRRVVNVTADVDETVANAREINIDLDKNLLPELKQGYPGLQYRFAGEERERNESLGSLLVTFPLALLAIYGLLAVQFRSYIQPAIVMSAIPFGIIGAVIGHILMGFVFMTKFNLGILSMFGIVALSGVVVNDSLILIDLINRERKSGIELSQVIRDCATRRFRPIMLTTLTTFFGLVPMMLERSLQARFLIPMAISLAFGVMFATLITLFLVPSLYMILEDIKSRLLTTQ